jgi:hypothetical protein
LFTIILLIPSANFLNFLINKNNIAFGTMIVVLLGLVGLQYFEVYNVTDFGGQIFDAVYTSPMYSILAVITLVTLYYANFKVLRNRVYLDEVVSEKVEEAKSVDLSFANRLGDVAPFI